MQVRTLTQRTLTQRTLTQRTVLGASGAIAMVVLTACGGASSTAESASTTALTAASGAAAGAGTAPDFAAFRSCMADNGVTLPDMGQRPAGGPNGVAPSGFPSGFPSGMPSGGPGAGRFPGGLPDGVDQATYDKATKACADVAPTFGAGRPGGGAAPDATALAAFKSCLSDHSVTVPDGDNWMSQLDRTDKATAAAMTTCAPLLPAPVAGGAAASPSAS
jgi:hypothetical protein